MEQDPIDPSEAAAVQRVLDANGVDAEQVLVMLMKTLVEDQVRAEAGKTGKRSAAVESNALQCMLAALMEQLDQSRLAYARRTANDAPENLESAESLGAEAPTQAEQIELQESLWEMTTRCLAIAENRAEIEKLEREKNPPVPRMRIVE